MQNLQRNLKGRHFFTKNFCISNLHQKISNLRELSIFVIKARGFLIRFLAKEVRKSQKLKNKKMKKMRFGWPVKAGLKPFKSSFRN